MRRLACLAEPALCLEANSRVLQGSIRTRVREGADVNTTKLSPGALIALGMVHFDTGDQTIAQRLMLPATKVKAGDVALVAILVNACLAQYLLESMSAQTIMLRIVARNLILWSAIEPSSEWVTQQLPTIVSNFGITEVRSHPVPLVRSGTALLTCRMGHHCHQARVPAFARFTVAWWRARVFSLAYGTASSNLDMVGHSSFAVALSYAGTCNEMACQTLLEYCRQYADLPCASAVRDLGRHSILISCHPMLVALGMVMAGSGDLRCLRLLRRLHAQHSTDV